MNITIILGIIVFLLIVFIVGFFIYYKNNNKKIFYLKEKRDNLSNLIEDYSQKIKELEQTIKINSDTNSSLASEITENQNSLIKIISEKDILKKEVKFLQDQIEDFDKSVDKAKELSKMQLKQLSENFDSSYNNLIDTYCGRIEQIEEQLDDLKEKRNAALQQAIKEYEEENKKAFYMLQISDEDLNDIKLLREIENKISKKEVIGKIIYKTYIEKYYTDLVGRVLNKEDFSGIYKITNQLNQMCYIGQAASIKKRWLQHIKRAVGAEPLINNKLYPAMQKYGIENFSFEVVDRCDKDKLNEREKYWQKFYDAKTFGYSIK